MTADDQRRRFDEATERLRLIERLRRLLLEMEAAERRQMQPTEHCGGGADADRRD